MNALIFVLFLILCWFQGSPDNRHYVNQPFKSSFNCRFRGFSYPKGTAFVENILSFVLSKNQVFGALGFFPFQKKRQATFPLTLVNGKN